MKVEISIWDCINECSRMSLFLSRDTLYALNMEDAKNSSYRAAVFRATLDKLRNIIDLENNHLDVRCCNCVDGRGAAPACTGCKEYSNHRPMGDEQ